MSFRTVLCIPLPDGSTDAQSGGPIFRTQLGRSYQKSLGQAFSKACGVQGQSPWSLHRNGATSPSPKISSARGSLMPAGIGRRGRIARASPMGKGRSMRPFPINERGKRFRLICSGGTTWGGTPLTIIAPFPPPTVRWTVVWRHTFRCSARVSLVTMVNRITMSE